jgi:hypothetical protein
MKSTYLILFLFCIVDADLFAQAETNNSTPVAEEIDKMETQIENVRLEVSNAIATQAHTNGPIDIAALTHTLEDATNVLSTNQIDERVAVEEKIIRDALIAMSRLDPGRSTNLDFSPDPLLERLKVLRGESSALRERISQLHSSIGQLTAWAAIMRSVLTDKAVASRIQGRMTEILRQWDASTSLSSTNAARSPSASLEIPAEGREVYDLEALQSKKSPSMQIMVASNQDAGVTIGTSSQTGDPANESLAAPELARPTPDGDPVIPGARASVRAASYIAPPQPSFGNQTGASPASQFVVPPTPPTYPTYAAQTPPPYPPYLVSPAPPVVYVRVVRYGTPQWVVPGTPYLAPPPMPSTYYFGPTIGTRLIFQPRPAATRYWVGNGRTFRR